MAITRYPSTTQWKGYAMTWSATGGTPSLGDGTLAGNYLTVSKACFFRMELLWGSTTSASGTTAWTFNLPLVLAGSAPNVFTAYITDLSAATITPTIAVPSSTVAFQFRTPAGGVVGNALPMTWANGDRIVVAGMFQI